MTEHEMMPLPATLNGRRLSVTSHNAKAYLACLPRVCPTCGADRGELCRNLARPVDALFPHAARRPGVMEGLPPLPTSLSDWHATVQLHRNPDYLRALADQIDQQRNGDRPTPDPRSVADLFAEFREPSPAQLRQRVEKLRAESVRLTGLADEIEGRVYELSQRTEHNEAPA